MRNGLANYRMLLSLFAAVLGASAFGGWLIRANSNIGSSTTLDRRAMPRLRCEPQLDPTSIPSEYRRAVETLCYFDVDVKDVAGDLHLVRLWAAQSDPTFQRHRLAARQVICSVFDHHEFSEKYHTRFPFVVRTRDGARFAENDFFNRSTERQFKESHVALTLSVLGELGVPLHASLRTSQGTIDLQAVVSDLVANFTPQMEQDWATVALAFYLPPQRKWTNKFNEAFSFDSQVDMLAERPLGSGSSCAGTHTLYTLSVLLGVDREVPILSETHRRRARGILEEALVRLERNQLPSGAWDVNWAYAPGQPPPELNRTWSVDREVLVTGHHLEWLAVAGKELRVSKHCLRRGINFIVDQLQYCDRQRFLQQICPYSHGPRAIGLLIGGSPGIDISDGFAR